MGFAAVAPLIGSAIGGMFSGGKPERSREEQQALAGAQGAGTALGGMGKQLYGTGTGMVARGQSILSQPTSYYQRLLSGNRALASQAVAAPRAQISDVYRGAERGLERSGVRGAARDVATGELSRQRAGQISSLITGVQPGAAQALTDIGTTTTGQGAGIAGTGAQATGGAGNIFAGLLGQGAANRQYAEAQAKEFGGGFGGLIFDLLRGGIKGKGLGGPAVPGFSKGPF